MLVSLDDFQGKLARCFREMMLAHAYIEIGHRQIAGGPGDAAIRMVLAEGIETEPYVLHELLAHRRAVNAGIVELFQTKAIAAWHDLLNALFAGMVGDHLDGTRQYPQMKRATARVDFSAQIPLMEQVRANLATDFAFKAYKDRIGLISSVLDSNDDLSASKALVRKHVGIRNVIQHHESAVNADMLAELGVGSLNLLDHQAKEIQLKQGDKIPLSVPELDALKGALFVMSSSWRKHYA